MRRQGCEKYSKHMQEDTDQNIWTVYAMQGQEKSDVSNRTAEVHARLSTLEVDGRRHH